MCVKLPRAQFQYIPNREAPFHPHMNSRISVGLYGRLFQTKVASNKNQTAPKTRNPVIHQSPK